MLFKSLTLLCFFISLALADEEKSQRPEWVESPQASCSAFHLCAVGSGTGKMSAQSAARAELARIFTAEINAKNSIQTSSKQESGADLKLLGQVTEDILMTVEDKTNIVLQGAEIKKTYEDNELVYALVALDKSVAAKAILDELGLIDEKLEAFYKAGNRYGLYQALRLYEERVALHWRYEFLAQKEKTPPVLYKQLLELKEQLAKKDVTLFLDVKAREVPENKRWEYEFTHLIAAQLLAQDYKVISKKDSPYHYKIIADLAFEKMHFNVKGFESYKFTLGISAYNLKDEKKGLIFLETTNQGRNFVQALENAMPEIKKQIALNIKELAID